MWLLIVPAVLAGLLGLLAHQAAEAADYVPRLRFLFLGAAGIGYVGLAAFFFRSLKGWRRWGAMVVSLAAIRIAYTLILATALLVTGWLDWLRALLGARPLPGVVHYALACFVAVLSTLTGLLLVASLANFKKIRYVVAVLAFVGMGVLAFWNPKDRALSPHPFESSGPAPAVGGPTYLDVVEDKTHRAVARILAAGGGMRHALSPRSGWGGKIREEMWARFRGDPALSLGERVTSLEAALLSSRSELRTSARNPRRS